MSQDTTASQILAKFQNIRYIRGVWEGHWQDIKELVRCDAQDFNRKQVQGYRRYDLVYDGTAIDANEAFANGLHSYLCSPTEPWFELNITDADSIKNDPQAKMWLDQVSDIIYDAYADPRVNFNPTMHEGFLDIGAFGNFIINQEWDYEEGHVVFRSFSLADCYYVENSKGMVDELFRYFTWFGSQIRKEWGDENLPPKLAKELKEGKSDAKEYRLMQYVGMRTKRDQFLMTATNKKFASIYICEQTMEVIEEGGYDEFPFTCSRWLKIAGETYGRGPAMKCLPDIKSLQAMEKTMLRAGQKAVDPPLILPDDGFILPFKTSPGSVNIKDSQDPNMKAEYLEFKGNVQFGQEQTDQKRRYIQKCFAADLFNMDNKKAEQTATEITDKRDEMLRGLAPMLGRQQTEGLGPIIQRTYNLLNRNGKIPPAPPGLTKKKLIVGYISPAARAQQGVKADKISRYMQDMTPFAQADPTIMDAIDTDKLAQLLADVRGVPRIVMRTPNDIAKIRQQRNQQQQMQQMAQTAEPASKSILNVAKAQQAQGGQA